MSPQVHLCVCACERACVRACVGACVRVCVCVCACLDQSCQHVMFYNRKKDLLSLSGNFRMY